MERSSGRRKKILIVLGVIAWLLMLGGISYYLCLPDLDEMSRNLRAIREDANLTPEERFEKSREIYSKLTLAEGKEVFQNDFKKWAYERNAQMQKFLKMSPEEQAAYLKQKAQEQKRLGPKDGFGIVKNGGVFKAGSGNAGGGMVKNIGGGPGGGGFFLSGPVGGGPKKPEQVQKTLLDNFSPETRAGQFYQEGLLSPK